MCEQQWIALGTTVAACAALLNVGVLLWTLIKVIDYARAANNQAVAAWDQVGKTDELVKQGRWEFEPRAKITVEESIFGEAGQTVIDGGVQIRIADLRATVDTSVTNLSKAETGISINTRAWFWEIANAIGQRGSFNIRGINNIIPAGYTGHETNYLFPGETVTDRVFLDLSAALGSPTNPLDNPQITQLLLNSGLILEFTITYAGPEQSAPPIYYTVFSGRIIPTVSDPGFILRYYVAYIEWRFAGRRNSPLDNPSLEIIIRETLNDT